MTSTVRKIKSGGQIPIKLWVKQMEYYFSITGITERNHVMGVIKHLDPNHFPEAELYTTFSYNEFRKKMMSLFKFLRFNPFEDQSIDVRAAEAGPGHSALQKLSSRQPRQGLSQAGRWESARSGSFDVLPKPPRAGSRQHDSHSDEGRYGARSMPCLFRDGLWQKPTVLPTVGPE